MNTCLRLQFDIEFRSHMNIDALKYFLQFRGAAVASVGMIKQALQRVVAKC